MSWIYFQHFSVAKFILSLVSVSFSIEHWKFFKAELSYCAWLCLWYIKVCLALKLPLLASGGQSSERAVSLHVWEKSMSDQMADAEFNFQQCSFLLELHILQIFLLPIKHSFILSSIKISPIYTGFFKVKREYTKIIQNGGFKMTDALTRFLFE